MAGFLAKFPDLDAVFAVNDPVAYYCEQEALAEKRSALFVVGMEGSPRSTEAMKDPNRLIAASPGEDPYLLAKAAVKLGVEIRLGQEKSGEVVLIPFTELTRANVDGFEGWTR
jgi:ribose transport system substrate-binding protein